MCLYWPGPGGIFPSPYVGKRFDRTGLNTLDRELWNLELKYFPFSFNDTGV